MKKENINNIYKPRKRILLTYQSVTFVYNRVKFSVLPVSHFHSLNYIWKV